MIGKSERNRQLREGHKPVYFLLKWLHCKTKIEKWLPLWEEFEIGATEFLKGGAALTTMMQRLARRELLAQEAARWRKSTRQKLLTQEPGQRSFGRQKPLSSYEPSQEQVDAYVEKHYEELTKELLFSSDASSHWTGKTFSDIYAVRIAKEVLNAKEDLAQLAEQYGLDSTPLNALPSLFRENFGK